MYRSQTAAAQTMPLDSFAVCSLVPVSPVAANDNEDERFDALAIDVVAILMRDGLKMLAG